MMNREDRAKQFAPFEALRGLREALAEKEREREMQSRKELGEEKIKEIQNTLLKLKKDDLVWVMCFERGYYITVEGRVTKIDLIYKFIEVESGKIFFEDIYEIKIN